MKLKIKHHELDAIINDKVFGWQQPTRRFSTDVNEAWRLVDILRDKEYSITVHVMATYVCVDLYKDRVRSFIHGDTVAEAICLAALNVLE